MVICPRCEQQVDETVRTTCPLCYTPLPIPGNAAASTPEQAAPAVPPMPPTAAQAGSAPQAPTLPSMPVGTPAMPPPLPPQMGAAPAATPPQAPASPSPSAMRPGARVSLTGEVYDQAMESSAPPPNYVGGNLPPARPAGPPRPTSPSGARRMPAEAPAKSGGGAAIAVVVVLVLALAGGGGWWFLNKRTNPKDQAHKFVLAQKAQDWNTLYNLTYLNEEDKKKYPNADALKQEFDNQMSQVDSNPMAKTMGLSSAALKAAIASAEIKSIGEPTYADGDATVPIALSVSIMGQNIENTQQVKLKNEMGVWKVVPNMNIPGVGGGGGAPRAGGF